MKGGLRYKNDIEEKKMGQPLLTTFFLEYEGWIHKRVKRLRHAWVGRRSAGVAAGSGQHSSRETRKAPHSGASDG